ncbi:dorsal-ventral patterning tolloid-like protein 1 [Mercenaria mercenaria]|uniref:dorsal-ventral patterning tolloid-like protein 1 n=1 Tax=Mercenaria mercenaria TaxID=6596 RepID=UPI001E1E0C58|nr:dorsal-ventral patterning tolloid-like protein 1 [Mercenaria mercenaria]
MCLKFEMAIIYSCLTVLIFWTYPASGQFTDCGGQLSADPASNGTLTSPNFPNNYPNDADCTWTIRCSGTDQNVTITFDTFILEGGDCFLYDWVTIDNGENIGNGDLGRFCGILTSIDEIVSHESVVTIHFRSDSEFVQTGFNLTYTCTGITDPPATDPPATDPPATDPPTTDPPATDPPATDPPATDPPATDPPIPGDSESEESDSESESDS